MRARSEFSLDRPFTASVLGGLVYDGKRYEQGAPFPWQRLGITNEGIWDLWAQFQVETVEPAAAPAVPVPPSPTAPAPPPAPQQPNRQQHQNHRHHRR